MGNLAYLAFYKANGNIYDWLVRTITRSKYSHVELVINGTCYSSSPRDGGVRSKDIWLDSATWDILEIDTNTIHALSVFQMNNGKKYDWFGAIKIFIPFFRNNPERYFCSEIIAMVLRLHEPHKWTPEKLYRAFKEEHHDQ